MTDFPTTAFQGCPEIAPDGLRVAPLLAVEGGSMAVFEVAAGTTGRAVLHLNVDEIWYVLEGQGEMWRWRDSHESITLLAPGVCLAIVAGTRFQVRANKSGRLRTVAVTLPPWSGDSEAQVVKGHWPHSVE